MTLTANHAIICYDNLLQSPLVDSITPTSERTGYNVENAYDWYTTSYWSPTAATGNHRIVAEFTEPVTADYFAIYRHNLGTVGGDVVLEYSDDGISYTAAFSAVEVADNVLKIVTFDSESALFWRVTFSLDSTTPFYCGVIMFGQKLSLYRGMGAGFVVPRNGRKNKIINQRTEGGQFVGRVKVGQGASSTIISKQVPNAWVREHWESFLTHAETLPFLFSWNHTFYPQDAVYCTIDGDTPVLATNETRHHDISLPINCLLSGDTP